MWFMVPFTLAIWAISDHMQEPLQEAAPLKAAANHGRSHVITHGAIMC